LSKCHNATGIENSLKLAQRQQRKEELFLAALEKAVKVLDTTNSILVRLGGDMYPTQPFNPSADRRTNNNNDDEGHDNFDYDESVESDFL